MNRKILVSLCAVVTAAIALSLTPSQPQLPSRTSLIADDGTQPAVPPKGPGAFFSLSDGTQPAVPPKGPGAFFSLDDGTRQRSLQRARALLPWLRMGRNRRCHRKALA